MSFIANIDPLSPLGTESLSQGDDQIRQLKQDIVDQFNDGIGWTEKLALTVAQINAIPADVLLRLLPTDYATSTVGGTVKARLSGTDLYLTIDGTDA